MPEPTEANTSGTSASASLDWDSLASALGAKDGEDAQKRAYDIAKFVAEVEKDDESQLILKTGSKRVELKLNRK